MDRTSPAMAEQCSLPAAVAGGPLRRVPRSPRGATRAAREARQADRRAVHPRPVGTAGRAAAVPARHRDANRGRPGLRDRRHQRVLAPQAALELPRPGSIRALQRQQSPAGIDHQGRLQSRPQAARRGGLELPASAQRVADAQAPPEDQPPRDRAAWRAQIRLHRRWAHLDVACSKKRTAVAVAVARELACFVWEVAQQPD